ncbi:hypothetical protein RYH80_03120 [Halobaculum sp. MBLA0147]|uniref:hypothetical protein n=1 Tax=Halobaculum sp. MBLA0147 TaxID=3079934 RepID=UPI0035248884
MLPQDDVQLEIDPDPELEREAEETARRVMSGGDLGIQRLSDTDVHVQRIPAEVVPQAKAMFEAENRGGGVGSFQQAQNEDRIEHIEDTLEWAIDNVSVQEESLETQEEKILDAMAAGDTEQVEALESAKTSIQERIAELYDHIGEQAEQIGLTDEQRKKLYSDQFDGERAAAEIGWSIAKGLVSLVTGMGPVIAALDISETTLRQFWEQTDGGIRERLMQIKKKIISERYTGDNSPRYAENRRE